ncbi:histidinol-phosphatase HisJ family protein [Beduini massiliensis]|uniref:histidinol-phosphatase HisJ family protein n=1 Tax=Beduini massiliensis TaxID=1585974 RepID=UPI000AE51101
MMIADYHMHTYYSDDSQYEMEEAVKKAISLGLHEICFTDHVDYGIKLEHDDYMRLSDEERKNKVANVDYEHYFEEIHHLQEKYKDQITIKQGMEFGIQTHTIPAFSTLFNAYDFDFIILSCHQVEDKEFWTQDFQKGRSQQDYNERYYQEILNVIKVYKDYSVLGHLDLLKRYDLEGEYPFEKTKDIITKILKIVIEDGKGIEINTSSFYYGLKDLMPSKNILKLYYELGGTILTIGSDSHKEEQVGAHIKEIQEELKKIGFKQICTFDKMKPIFHDL